MKDKKKDKISFPDSAAAESEFEDCISEYMSAEQTIQKHAGLLR